jgi:hypothetical protein
MFEFRRHIIVSDWHHRTRFDLALLDELVQSAEESEEIAENPGLFLETRELLSQRAKFIAAP